MVAMEHKRKTSWDSKISVSTVSTRRFSRAGTPSSILSSDSDIRFTRKLGSQYRCGCCILAAFLLLLLLAGVVVYIAHTFVLADQPRDQVFLATFRVAEGDAFLPELADPSTEAFRQRSRSYRDRLNLVFKRSPLQSAFVAAEILALDGIEYEDLYVRFDARFDARYAKNLNSETIRSILERELDPASNRFFGNLTIDVASIEVQESVSAVNQLALQTNGSSGTGSDDEDGQPATTTSRPWRSCSPRQFSYCSSQQLDARHDNLTTSYPNWLGHQDLQEVNDDIIAFRELVDAECYERAYDFICQLLQPACVESPFGEDALRPPCRDFCREFWAGCGSRLPERLRQALDCSNFPEHSDEASCLPKPGCVKDLKSAALSSRVCDGIADCPDFSDELDCAYCRKGEIHCGLGTQCIAKSKRCDGKVDCPSGSDEKDCLSLAPSLRSLSLQPDSSAHPISYQSEGWAVFNEKGTLGKICTENLNASFGNDKEIQSVLQSTANSLCTLLSFEGVKSVETRVDNENNVPYVLMQDPKAAEISFVRAACPSKQVMYVRCSELVCGVQSMRTRSSSLNKISSPGDWPWHVSLFKEDNHVCDATLVSDEWLLTTASCFQGQPKAEWSARFGHVRLTSRSPWQLERRIVGMVKSPVEGSTVVLLKLDRPIEAFSDFVRPVCLPSQASLVQNAEQCNTLGWTKNREVLQRVQVRYSPMEKCENVSIASVNSVCTEAYYPTDDCAEEEVAGSPLLCLQTDSQRWSIHGISSWRIGCPKAGMERPRLYDQISSNLAWIKSTIK
ncbi:atrial natriuretic peptide-converting enzyme [Trichogramma pretiosum]|uniref:atrial natriuretic peptide-converting enzyme n=1 Tax=Trichogramma pretiosum TaxID=7493 RepID=UPI0006C9650E|nr:atrial natriuretic peptide-converting enzyme [Trichogramma pretiosum]